MYIDVNTIITTIVTTIATALIAWLIAQLTSFIKAKAEKSRAEKKWEELDHYTKIANETIVKLVDYMNTMIVNKMKVASDSGELTEEEGERIKEALKYKLYGMLTTEAMEAMKCVYGDLDSIFDMWIENAVANAKTCGSGISKDTALGMAKAQDITHEQRRNIKDSLACRLEGIVDTMSTS